jgi:hypothetical protein
VAQDHNDIYSIVERLAILEGRITPTNVKHGLNAQQKSVPQLPALFKPKTQKILGGNPNAKNPMAGYAVGGCEESEELEETITSEDVLDKVKNSLADYLKNAEEQIKQDRDLLAKKKQDLDLKKKELKDLDLQEKQQEQTDEAYDMDQLRRDAAAGLKTSTDKASDARIAALKNPPKEKSFMSQVGDKIIGGVTGAVKGAAQGFTGGTGAVEESTPVKTITNECGSWEIYEDKKSGFEIRHGNRKLPTRFKNLDEAEMALEMFNARRRKSDAAQDYIEEA